MRHMPAIPESTRDSITWRLILHAEKNWPQLDKVQVTYRSGFAYVAGVLPSGEQIPLCRLRYGGSAHSFGFAIYSTARERYEDSLLRTGLPTGTPQEALDTACTVHLTGLGHEPGDQPPTNLRPGPLRERRTGRHWAGALLRLARWVSRARPRHMPRRRRLLKARQTPPGVIPEHFCRQPGALSKPRGARSARYAAG
jgi:hypothetical protein